jgi:peptidoglycan/LPS O-acetylase OafA/YrhL
MSNAARARAAPVGTGEPQEPPPADAVGATLRSTIPALEGLRGVAILTVLAHQLLIEGYPAPRMVRLALAPFQVGWVGVQLFFVLSGFLINGILLDTRRAENYWSSFYARRALRIFPVYYLLLVGTFVVAPRLFAFPEEMLAEHRHQVWYWLYLANAHAPSSGGAVGSLGHCWSLSVEEQFYLAWPVAVRLLGARGLGRLCLGIAVAALLLRVGLRLAGESPELCYELTPARSDALALGALGAVVVRSPARVAWIAPRLGKAMAATLSILAVVALAGGGLARLNPLTQTAGYTMLAVLSALVILAATLQAARGEGRLAAFLSAPILRRYGKYSYAIYVFHLPLHLFVTRTFFAPRLSTLGPTGFLGLQLAYLVGGALVLYAVGAVSYRLLERPFLGWKRFFVARTETLTA